MLKTTTSRLKTLVTLFSLMTASSSFCPQSSQRNYARCNLTIMQTDGRLSAYNNFFTGRLTTLQGEVEKLIEKSQVHAWLFMRNYRLVSYVYLQVTAR